MAAAIMSSGRAARPAEPAAGASWETVRAWRIELRRALIEERLAVPAAQRSRAARRVADSVAAVLHGIPDVAVGLYWPFRGELDLRAIAGAGRALAKAFALPVVVEKGRALEFRRWHPGARLARGVWNIPVPADGEVVSPDVLVVPLLGHDGAGYRLGYGGGYYDRTLGAARPAPLAIGVGLAAARLRTIHPQPHDVPMDVVITEEGVARHRA